MIEPLYEIGAIQAVGDFLDEYIEDIGSGYKHVFKIMFTIDDADRIAYKEIGYEEFDPQKKLKYLYKKGSPRGSDRTPTSKITELSKTFNEKTVKSVQTFIKDNESAISERDKTILQRIDACLEANKEKINEELTLLAKESMAVLTREDNIADGGIITLAFEKNGRSFYLGDLDLFTNTFLQQEKAAFKSYYYSKTRNEECRRHDKTCFVCKRDHVEVWGLVGTFKSYTVDKPGMVSGGFNQADAWKNYPVCPDCAVILNRGRRYIDENLRHRFCGFDYFIIPQLSVKDRESLNGVLRRLRELPGFTLAEKKAARIEKIEERIIQALAEEKNFINFNFLFFKEEQSGAVFNILLYLQEIAPTRLRRLIEAKDRVDDMSETKFPLFDTIKTKKGEEIDFDFRFGLIRTFFPNNKEEGDHDKEFLAVVNHVFIGQPIAYDLLLKRFTARIRRDFLNDRPYNHATLRAYKIVLYIDQLKLLKRRTFNVANEADYLKAFFVEHPIFDENTKRALFLEGVLAEKLLNIQYRQRQSSPFRSRLNGLKIDERVAKRLLPEMMNKLEEYDANHFYKELEAAIAHYMLGADFSRLSVFELSFYFALGMALANKVLPKKTDQKEDKESSDE